MGYILYGIGSYPTSILIRFISIRHGWSTYDNLDDHMCRITIFRSKIDRLNRIFSDQVCQSWSVMTTFSHDKCNGQILTQYWRVKIECMIYEIYQLKQMSIFYFNKFLPFHMRNSISIPRQEWLSKIKDARLRKSFDLPQTWSGYVNS